MSYVPPHLRNAKAAAKIKVEDNWTEVKPRNRKNEPKEKKEEFPELKSELKSDAKQVTFQPLNSVPPTAPKMDFSKLFKNAGPKPVVRKPMKRGLVLLSKTRPKDSMTEEEWKQEEEEILLVRQDLHFQKITLDLEKRRNNMREYDPSYESEHVITSSSEEDVEEVVEDQEEEEDVVEDELEDE
jgi:hypothetical protein